MRYLSSRRLWNYENNYLLIISAYPSIFAKCNYLLEGDVILILIFKLRTMILKYLSFLLGTYMTLQGRHYRLKLKGTNPLFLTNLSMILSKVSKLIGAIKVVLKNQGVQPLLYYEHRRILSILLERFLHLLIK